MDPGVPHGMSSGAHSALWLDHEYFLGFLSPLPPPASPPSSPEETACTPVLIILISESLSGGTQAKTKSCYAYDTSSTASHNPEPLQALQYRCLLFSIEEAEDPRSEVV